MKYDDLWIRSGGCSSSLQKYINNNKKQWSTLKIQSNIIKNNQQQNTEDTWDSHKNKLQIPINPPLSLAIDQQTITLQ